jgi:hypothetical protein
LEEAYLVVDVVGPGTPEEVLQCTVVGWEFVFGQNVISNHTGLAKLSLFVKRGLKRIGMFFVAVIGRR